MQPDQQHLSQAKFADHMGVTRAAVSQWKAKDILRDDAFTLPGKKGKLIVAVAVDQVRRNRNIGQSLGNGIETRTSLDGAPEVERPRGAQVAETEPASQHLSAVPDDQPDAAPLEPKRDTVEDQLKRARLEEQHRKNRMGAAEEARQQGKLMSAEDAREQMARVAVMMLQIFEGSLTDFAASIASQFSVPQRDVLHLLKNEFRQVRQSATQKERARLASLERNVTTAVELDE